MTESIQHKEKYFRCMCDTHLLRINHSDTDVFISFWSYAHPRSTSWRNRIKHIWNILKTGSPYADSLVLDKAEFNAFKEFLATIEINENPFYTDNEIILSKT